jgi:hypothetical protein
MPDVHVGKGSTVGCVIPTLHAVIPAAVGVDIGCGMMAAKTTLTASDLPDSLSAIRSAIERAVPGECRTHEQPGRRRILKPNICRQGAYVSLREAFLRTHLIWWKDTPNLRDRRVREY